jgi:hypothetical protein
VDVSLVSTSGFKWNMIGKSFKHPSTFIDYLLEPDVESINFFLKFSNKIKNQMKSEVHYQKQKRKIE